MGVAILNDVTSEIRLCEVTWPELMSFKMAAPIGVLAIPFSPYFRTMGQGLDYNSGIHDVHVTYITFEKKFYDFCLSYESNDIGKRCKIVNFETFHIHWKFKIPHSSISTLQVHYSIWTHANLVISRFDYIIITIFL